MARRSGTRLLKLPDGKTVARSDETLAEAEKQVKAQQAAAEKQRQAEQAKADKAAAKNTPEK